MSGVEFNTWKVADLKAELKSKGLPVSGNKQDLIERLQNSLLDEGDDLLDQDDSMTPEAILKAEEELKVTKTTTTPAAAPKINREGPAVVTEESSPVKNTEPKPEGKENAPANTSPTKVSAVTSPAQTEDKLKARAERFGGFQSDEAKKAARAARFGVSDGTVAKGGDKKLAAAPAVDADTLKKRAERFGGSVSSSLKNLEVQEAIKRRQERFGVVEKNEPKPKKVMLNSASGNSVVLDEKMKARQQRFGLAPN